MKIFATQFVKTSSHKITFKSKNDELDSTNIDKYLQSQNVSLQHSYNDLRSMRTQASIEKSDLLHLKRNKNEEVEASKIEEKFINFFERYNDIEIYKRIRRSQRKPNEGILDLNHIFAVDNTDYLKSIGNNTPNSEFTNSIIVPHIDYKELHNATSDAITKQISEHFISFRDNDTNLFNKSMDAFSQISNVFFKDVSEELKQIKEMHSKQKWSERIPYYGLTKKIPRIMDQQTSVKELYATYDGYCEKYIHAGIRPIAKSYLEKLEQVKIYIDQVKPKMSNSDINFADTALREMNKLAIPILERYTATLLSVTTNGEGVAEFYRSINKNGNIALAIRTLTAIIGAS